MALLAPNVNSYRRYEPNIFVPISRSWGHENRSVALRVPASGGGAARRIEHRIAGADANPYLVTAAVLAGMHAGLERGQEPWEEATPREADLSDDETTLPTRLDEALRLFREGSLLRPYLGEQYVDTFAAMRQGESDDYHGRVPDIDYAWFLRAL